MPLTDFRKIPDNIAKPWAGDEEPAFFRSLRLAHAVRANQAKSRLLAACAVGATLNGVIAMLLGVAWWAVLPLVGVLIALSKLFVWMSERSQQRYDTIQEEAPKMQIVSTPDEERKAS